MTYSIMFMLPQYIHDYCRHVYAVVAPLPQLDSWRLQGRPGRLRLSRKPAGLSGGNRVFRGGGYMTAPICQGTNSLRP